MKIFSIILMVISPTAAFAAWETNMPRGVTPTSEIAYDLHMLIFYITVVIGILVFGAMLYSIIYHRKSLGHKPASFHESTKVEIIWTVIPFIILVGMAVPATKALILMEDTRDSEITLKVTGYQWMWQYEYLEDSVSFFSKIDNESNVARRLDSGVDVTVGLREGSSSWDKASEAGLNVGMVISQISQKNIESPDKAKEIFEDFIKRKADSILLQVYEGDFSRFLVLKLD